MISDYWVELKYYMSGLKLLAEISYMKLGNRETILALWFRKKESDPLKADMSSIIESGIREDHDVSYMVRCMTERIPKEKLYEADSRGCTFLSCNPEKAVEQIYSESEHRNKFIRIYEGLVPGVDEFGQSFADLHYEFKAIGKAKNLEDEFQTGSLKAWEKTISLAEDEELALLATGLSRTGRHQLLAGLKRERIPGIVMQSVLYGPDGHGNTDAIADRLLHKWLELTERG